MKCNGKMENGPGKKFTRCQKCGAKDYEANEGDVCGKETGGAKARSKSEGLAALVSDMRRLVEKTEKWPPEQATDGSMHIKLGTVVTVARDPKAGVRKESPGFPGKGDKVKITDYYANEGVYVVTGGGELPKDSNGWIMDVRDFKPLTRTWPFGFEWENTGY